MEVGINNTTYKVDYVNKVNQLTFNIIKTEVNTLQYIKIADDNTLIYSNYIQYDKSVLDQTYFDYTYISDEDYKNNTNNNQIYSLCLIDSNKTVKYSRRATKLHEFIALIGGFIHLILLVGSFICKDYNDYEKNMALIKEIFDFKDDTQTNENNGELLVSVISKAVPNNNVLLSENQQNKVLNSESHSLNQKGKYFIIK